jgi:hypothetical protein
MNGFRYVASQVVAGVVALHTSATLLPRSREAAKPSTLDFGSRSSPPQSRAEIHSLNDCSEAISGYAERMSAIVDTTEKSP